MKAGDVIELPKGVLRTGGSWQFRVRRKDQNYSFVDKDYEKVIAHAEKYWAEHKTPEGA